MRLPFDGNPQVTNTFQEHINAGGDRSFFRGTDWGLNYEPVYAVEDGMVSSFTDEDGAKIINLYSGGKTGIIYQYVHLDSYIPTGIVKQGQKIGISGNTGGSYGPHLHFAVIVNGIRVDPEIYFKDNLVFTKEQVEEILRAIEESKKGVVNSIETNSKSVIFYTDENTKNALKKMTPQVYAANSEDCLVEVTRDLKTGKVIYRHKKGKKFSAWTWLSKGITNVDPSVYYDPIGKQFVVKARDLSNKLSTATSADGATWSAYTYDEVAIN